MGGKKNKNRGVVPKDHFYLRLLNPNLSERQLKTSLQVGANLSGEASPPVILASVSEEDLQEDLLQGGVVLLLSFLCN